MFRMKSHYNIFCSISHVLSIPLLNEERTTLLNPSVLSASWQVLPTLGETPAPRVNATMSLHESSESVFLFGGYDHENAKVQSDFWVLYLRSETWRQFDFSHDDSTVPAERYGHAAVVLGSKLIIFGLLHVNGQFLSIRWIFWASFSPRSLRLRH